MDQLVDESQVITGWCKECPPGFELQCVKVGNGYPDGPPAFSSCIFEDRNIVYGNEFIDVGDGILNFDQTGNRGVVKYDYDLETVIWVLRIQDVETVAHTSGVIFPLFVTETGVNGELLMSCNRAYDKGDGYSTDGTGRSYLISSEGKLIRKYTTLPQYSYCYEYGKGIGITDGGSTFVVSTYHQVPGSGYIMQAAAMKFNINTGDFVEFLIIGPVIPNGGEVSCRLKVVDSKIFFAMPMTKTSSRGMVKYMNHDGSNETMLGEGLESRSAQSKDLFGSDIYLTKKYIVVFTGGYGFIASGYPKSVAFYQWNMYCRLEIYDRFTYAHVKTVMDPMVETYQGDYNSSTGPYSSTGFGVSLHEYGNWIIIGAPNSGFNLSSNKDEHYLYRKGYSFVYDSDFNLLQNMAGLPLAGDGSEMGYGVYANSHAVYTFGNGYTVGQNDTRVRVCTYAQIGE